MPISQRPSGAVNLTDAPGTGGLDSRTRCRYTCAIRLPPLSKSDHGIIDRPEDCAHFSVRCLPHADAAQNCYGPRERRVRLGDLVDSLATDLQHVGDLSSAHKVVHVDKRSC